MKKLLALLLASMMTAGMVSCGTGESGDSADNTESTSFTLDYTEGMTAQGYEPLVLDEVPSRIACTSTSSVTTLYEMGASMIAIPTSSATSFMFDENPDLVALKSISHDEFNIEDVVALNPDLVIISTSYADSHGATLENLGINVYYQAAGHGVSYDTVKEEALCLIDAFAIDEESRAKADELKKKFADTEAACEAASSENAGKKIMVLQAGGVGMVYGQTSGGTLGSMMNMLGFDNVADATAAASMFAIDYETALAEQPDLLVVVGAGDAAATEAVMDEIIAANPEYWNAMTAVANDQILCLGVEYIAVYGIGYLDAIDRLVDTVNEFYAD